jgi:hypothetical protein
MFSLAAMGLFVVLAMKLAGKGFAAEDTGVIGFGALCDRRIKSFGKIAQFRMERSCVVLQILFVGESFCSKTFRDLTLVWPIVNVDVAFLCFDVGEALREISAGNFSAFKPSLLVVKSGISRRFSFAQRFGIFEELPVTFESIIKALDTDFVSCFESFLLERVDVRSEQH